MATKNVEISSDSSNHKILATEKYKSARQWFWSGLIRYPWLMIPSWLTLLVNSVLSVMPSILIGLAIDVFIADGYGRNFIIILVSIIGVALISWATSFLGAYLWGLASYRFERDIRQEFFDVVQEHSMAFHDEHDSGILLSMGMNETAQMRFAFHPAMRHLFNSLLSIILVTTYFFIRISIGSNVIGIGNWQIGLGVSFSFIIYLLLAWIYAARIGPIRRELAIELGNVSSTSQETFRGIDVVRSFDNETTEEEKFNVQSSRLAEKTKQEGYVSAFYWPTLIMVIVTGAAFGIGIWLVKGGSGAMTAGQLTAMLTLLIQLVALNLMMPVRLLALQAGFVNANRIWKCFEYGK